MEGIGERLYNLKDDLGESRDLCGENRQLCDEMKTAYKEWEKGIITPMLWNEGIWHEVCQEMHRSLMNNQEVTCFSPQDLKEKSGEKKKK